MFWKQNMQIEVKFPIWKSKAQMAKIKLVVWPSNIKTYDKFVK